MAPLSRRSFLALFSAAAAGYMVGDYDPKKLAWFAPPELEAAVAALPELPAPGTLILGEPMPAPLLTLSQLTREVLVAMRDELNDPRFTLFDYHDMRVGDTGRLRVPRAFRVDADYYFDVKDVPMTHNYACSFVMDGDLWTPRRGRSSLAQIHDAVVRPMAAQLARQVRHKRLNCFGELALPLGVAEAARASDSKTGLSVRAVRQYDCHIDRFYTQVEILGGRG